jgi:alkaline phosphatase D
MDADTMTSPRSLKRRDFIRGVGAGAIAVATMTRSIELAASTTSHVFSHGIASGDPLADRVIIWTRLQPGLGASVPVLWDVALDPAFTRMVRRGRALALAERDHTVKVDVLGLPSNAVLYFRFVAAGATSPVGRTRTLPVGAVSSVRLAVFSCSNYPAGYFHAYAEAARLGDIDVAVHLGDYIYEYPSDGYASEDAGSLGRVSDPSTELFTLTDYRRRYAQYRSDADLQAAHAAIPFICVWDDHEIANDTWRLGAENHDPATEGDFVARRTAAMRAYYEWMPIRTPDPQRLDRIYRSFRFGNLLDLHMLDTRIVGRALQLDYANYVGASGFDAARFTQDLTNPTRQLLGAEQAQWLQQRLQGGSGVWTVLGQQVLMGRMNIPAPLLLNPALLPQYGPIVAKLKSGAPLTAQETALMSPSIPYNLDAWDGYFVARETVLGTARALQKNLVVLAGDTHNAWASDLKDIGGNEVGVEFATHSVSSPGFEEFFPTIPPSLLADTFMELIGPLVYAETASRGFMVVTATPYECRADWHVVTSVKTIGYAAHIEKSLRTFPGAGNRHLISA